MAGVGLYLAVRAIGALIDHAGPETTLVGVLLTGASAVVLPVLARAKLRLAKALKVPAYAATGCSVSPARCSPRRLCSAC
jgi:divalent metal cation (Fe/Co/Zn/Cd) transporter